MQPTREELKLQIDHQERRILELRAKLAEAEKRIAQQQAFITKLKYAQPSRRGQPPMLAAERIFASG